MKETDKSVAKLCYSVQETAKALGLCKRTVHRLVARGELSAVRAGDRVLIPVRALDEFISRQTVTK